MLNLIRKDIMLLRNTLLLVLPFLFVALFLGRTSIFVGVIFSIAFIMSAFSFDEKSEANILLNALPYTRKEIVSSKYIGVFIFVLIVAFTIFIGNLIIYRELTPWSDIFLIFSIVMIIISLFFPFSYKFKSQYLFIGTIALFVIFSMVANVVANNMDGVIRDVMHVFSSMPTYLLYLAFGVLSLALYVGSWLLSLRIYEKKVF